MPYSKKSHITPFSGSLTLACLYPKPFCLCVHFPGPLSLSLLIFPLFVLLFSFFPSLSHKYYIYNNYYISIPSIWIPFPLSSSSLLFLVLCRLLLHRRRLREAITAALGRARRRGEERRTSKRARRRRGGGSAASTRSGRSPSWRPSPCKSPSTPLAPSAASPPPPPWPTSFR